MSLIRRLTRASPPNMNAGSFTTSSPEIEEAESCGQRLVRVTERAYPVCDPDHLVIEEEGERSE